MCRDEISRAHSVLVGMAVRLAECMGFHRDPEEYDYGPVESHVRRMIWYQLYFLDLKTSELQGPRPAIRREDFSTKFPINMDDTEISTAKTRSIIDMPRWTDMTYTRIRFECQEFRRMLFRDRVRLEKKKVGLTQVIAKIEAFRKATYAKYGPLIHVPDPTPIQKAAQHMLSILLARAYIFVLQRYLNGVAFNVPERLRQIAVTYGTRMLEDSMELETSPELSLWAWYQSAFNPYHVTLLLLMEVWCNPTIQEADRIWRCLDYVFEVSSLAPELCESGKSQDIRRRDTKARLLLTIVRDRMIAYQERRRLKVPTNMADPKTLPPVLERRKSYAASFKTEASDKECESTASQQSQYQTAVPQHGSLAGNISQQYDGQYARPSHLQDILQSQSSFPHPQYYQHYMAAPQPASQPFSQASFFPSSSAHRPSLSSSSSFGLGRASSGDSEKIESQGSGSSKLWFVSDAGLGSAGAAPPMADDAFVAFPTSYQHQDEGGTIPVEIDWVSDPFVSGGVTSFQFQQLPGNSSGYSSRGLPA